MFNFTTQSVYNTIATSGANKNMWVAADSKKPALRIGNTRFDKDYILDIQVKNPTVETLATVEFDMSEVLLPQDSIDNEGTGRIALYIGLSMNSQDSLYANDLVYKGKPLFIEFPIKKTDTADVLATRVKTIADKYMLLVYGQKILNIETTATAAVGADPGPASDAVGKVKFTGINGYQQFKKAVLQFFDPDAKTLDCCTNQGEYKDVIVGVPVVYSTSATGVVTPTETKIDETGTAVALADNEVAITPGLEAFCDYNWIIHNLRLPTVANYYPWSPSNRMGEMPVPGQQYTQFIIRICKERDGIMGEIVGARGTSVTTHVLYVAGLITDSSSAAYAVNGALTTLLGGDASTKMLTDADDQLQDPYNQN